VPFQKTILLLGSGELGKEFTISAKRLGQKVIAVDKYVGAPAMQLADGFEVIDMLDGAAIEAVVQKHKPDVIVPEIEAIRTEKLKDFEARGIQVVPTAKAAHYTMNRDAIRDLAAHELKLKTAKFEYAENLEELKAAVRRVGLPCVVKPIMSSSGKGQSTLRKNSDVEAAWDYAVKGMRGDRPRVIVEEFIAFDYEITLLTVKQKKGPTLYVAPIGHRQEHGDYRESWMPAKMSRAQLNEAKKMAKKITDRLGGAGVFGVEFFVTRKEVYFSELSPRPHDTGLVTLISQNLSEFDLHARAVLGLPIPDIEYYGPSASRVILATKEADEVKDYLGVPQALAHKRVDVRIFDKPSQRKGRRMGVVLARGKSLRAAVQLAVKAARRIRVE
jgi:phosphoribosylglycinamide formyltransferase 2